MYSRMVGGGTAQEAHATNPSPPVGVRTRQGKEGNVPQFSFLRAKCLLTLAFLCLVAISFTWRIENVKDEADPLARSRHELALHGPRPDSLQEFHAKLRHRKNKLDAHRETIRPRCFFSQHNEDVIMLQRFLGHITGGFFVELGALDGVTFSVSLFFERYMNWSGILIEGSPVNAAKYYEAHAHLRPHSEFVAGAVCAAQLPSNGAPSADVGGGLQQPQMQMHVTLGRCLPCSQMLHVAPPEKQIMYRRNCVWMNVAHGEVDYSFFSKHISQGKCVISPVSCIRVHDVLMSRCVTKVDLFILDMEEAELEVLRTVDLVDGPPIHFFVVELSGNNEKKDRAVRQILRNAHYVLHGRIALGELWQLVNFDLALRRYVKRMRQMPQCNYSSGGVALYGPLATPAVHQQWMPHCLRRSVTPESFFLTEQQWTPPFFSIDEVPSDD